MDLHLLDQSAVGQDLVFRPIPTTNLSEPSPQLLFDSYCGNRKRGLRIKTLVLQYFCSLDGDKSGILEEVRRQLPAWKEKKFPTESHTLYVANSLELLAQVGSQQDLELIGGFLEDDDAMIRSDAKRQFATLKERLAKESVNRDPNRTRKHSPASQPIGVTDGRVSGSPADSPARDWRWAIGIAIVFLTECGYLLIKRSTSG